METLKATTLTKFISFLFAGSLFWATSSCGQNKQEVEQKSSPSTQPVKEQLLEANKSRVEIESDRIDAFAKRRNWKMKKTGTGLRYMVYEKGEGAFAKAGDVALVNFTVSLLDGTVCYSSNDSGAQSFKVGMDNVESGLHEGICFLNKGSKAKLILPSHLAHGLVGDRKKIPANATVIYDLELLELQ